MCHQCINKLCSFSKAIYFECIVFIVNVLYCSLRLDGYIMCVNSSFCNIDTFCLGGILYYERIVRALYVQDMYLYYSFNLTKTIVYLLTETADYKLIDYWACLNVNVIVVLFLYNLALNACSANLTSSVSILSQCSQEAKLLLQLGYKLTVYDN